MDNKMFNEYVKISQDMFKEASSTVSNWYEKFNRKEAANNLANNAAPYLSQASSWINNKTSELAPESWVASHVSQLDSFVQEMLGQDFKSTDGEL